MLSGAGREGRIYSIYCQADHRQFTQVRYGIRQFASQTKYQKGISLLCSILFEKVTYNEVPDEERFTVRSDLEK